MYLYEVPDGPAAASLSQSQRRGRRGDAKGSGPAVAPRRSFVCPAALLRPTWTPSPVEKPSSIQAPGWHRPGLDRLTGCRTGWNFFNFFIPRPRCHPPSLPPLRFLALLACLPAHRPLWFRRPHPRTRSTQACQAGPPGRPGPPVPSNRSTGSIRAIRSTRSTRSTSCSP